MSSLLLISVDLFMEVNNLGEDVLCGGFRLQNSEVCAFSILLELATRESIFPNVKLCFVLDIVCVTLLGLERWRLSDKSQMSQQEDLKSAENCKARCAVYIPSVKCDFNIVFLYMRALIAGCIWAVFCIKLCVSSCVLLYFHWKEKGRRVYRQLITLFYLII